MQNIYVLNDRKQKKSTKLVSVFMGVLILVLGIYIESIYGLVCGILLLASGIFKKITAVNQDGILIIYDARVYKYREIWAFTDIKELHIERGRENNKKVLHFTKGAMSKMLIFNSDDADRVVQAAISKNPNIHLDEAYYSK